MKEPELLTTEELAARIKYDPRTIRERLKGSALQEGKHFVRPFGGRKILYNWDVIKAELGLELGASGATFGDATSEPEINGKSSAARREQVAPPDEPRGEQVDCHDSREAPLTPSDELRGEQVDFHYPREAPLKPFGLREALTVIESVRADYSEYVLTRFFTGLTAKEAGTITWDNVDLAESRLHVGAPSPRGMWRSVALVEPVVAALRRQRARTERLGETVFCSHRGVPIVDHNFIHHVWYPLLKALGLDQRHPDNMRHTFALLLMAAGESVDWIASQLGGCSGSDVMRRYVNYLAPYTRPAGEATNLYLQSALARGRL